MIERDFDVPFVARLAQREKQIQQSYRPVIGIHKWFARRPGTLFRALLLAEFTNGEPLASRFFQSHDLHPLTVGDPFMGGGTPVLEANRLGCHVVGVDINPMAYWIVRQELDELDREKFQAAAQEIILKVEEQIGELYHTTCTRCGNPAASVKYFLWVKQQTCTNCSKPIDLFPSYLVAKNQRHPNYVLVCAFCGVLNEVASLNLAPGQMSCRACKGPLTVEGPAKRNRCRCPHCHHQNPYPRPKSGPPVHRLFALEYYCSACESHKGRFFKEPDSADLARLDQAEARLRASPQQHIPADAIPPGDETTRLHRWGYKLYRELFNTRQLLGLETLATAIWSIEDERVRNALLTVFSDTLRYQNMVCRYDTYALKIIDIFSVHGFPVSLIQCENSLLGTPGIGSGGFRHFVEKYDRAKAYCERPFETLYNGRSKKTIYLRGERIRARLVSEFPHPAEPRAAYLQATSAETLWLPSASLDAVLTDPPYFANVQYAELIDFCYVWLRKHLADSVPAFRAASTRSEAELTVNLTEGRGITDFTDGLSRVFATFAGALKPGAPYVFTYHHNDVEAYLPIAVALLDAKLVCTSTLPCPAEMGASLHINGTKSAVVDTIFVCRTTGTVRASQFQATPQALMQMLKTDFENLQQAGMTPKLGDARCLLLGHLVRLVVWQLRQTWNPEDTVSTKLNRVRSSLEKIYPSELLDRLGGLVISSLSDVDLLASMRVRENRTNYDDAEDTIPF